MLAWALYGWVWKSVRPPVSIIMLRGNYLVLMPSEEEALYYWLVLVISAAQQAIDTPPQIGLSQSLWAKLGELWGFFLLFLFFLFFFSFPLPAASTLHSLS